MISERNITMRGKVCLVMMKITSESLEFFTAE